MTQTFIIKAGLVDLLNSCVWTATILREATIQIGNGYRFDGGDQCVYWEGDHEKFMKEFARVFPWSCNVTNL